MDTAANKGLRALTDKEKQTLRLIVRGHDAKSTARSLGLSVHTINERLRDARRKLAVSSSREAARLLLAAEGGEVRSPNPDFLGDTGLRGDAIHRLTDQESAPIGGAGQRHRRLRIIIIGVTLVITLLGLLALSALPQLESTPAPPKATATASAADADVLDAARQWLALVDQGRWDNSYRATGKPFRKLNTPQAWAAASEKMRASLGSLTSRTFVGEENLPAPPLGYEVVKFRTSFSNKPDAVETVSLDREEGQWRVVGVTID